jgi:iron complex transport system ATP-binding protein
MLEAENIQFHHGNQRVLDGLSARVEPCRIQAMVGPNGTGKTTFLKCILGILKPAGGSVRVDGEDTLTMDRREVARRIGYVPQSLPGRFSATVFETVLAGRRPHMAWRPSGQDLERTASVIEEMNLTDLAMRDMDRLSGGQAQKVLLARALAQEAPFLLLDEPTSSLDLRHQLEMLELIGLLARQRRMGVLMAMHDLNLAARFADSVLMVERGRVVCSGPPSEVMTPGNIAAVYGVEADVRRENGFLRILPLRCTPAGHATSGTVPKAEPADGRSDADRPGTPARKPVGKGEGGE